MKTLPVNRTKRVLALHGHGIKIFTRRGHLVLEDGVADERETQRIPRASRAVSRVVMHGESGYVTFEALRWMRDTSIRFVQLGNDQEVITLNETEPDIHLSVLRRQLEVSGGSVALDIARDLMRRKIRGQKAILGEIAPEAVAGMVEQLELLEEVDSPAELLNVEANAAHFYWTAWTGIPLHLKDPEDAPEHWRTFRSRRSLLSKNGRYAVDPINAILNYLYTLLYVEATLTLRTIGLDPRIGVLHTDVIGRNSLACDLMEAVRPEVDRWALELLRDRVFRSNDFFENREGHVRLMPTVTRRLVKTMPRWGRACWNVAKPVYEGLVGKRVRRRG